MELKGTVFTGAEHRKVECKDGYTGVRVQKSRCGEVVTVLLSSPNWEPDTTLSEKVLSKPPVDYDVMSATLTKREAEQLANLLLTAARGLK